MLHGIKADFEAQIDAHQDAFALYEAMRGTSDEYIKEKVGEVLSSEATPTTPVVISPFLGCDSWLPHWMLQSRH